MFAALATIIRIILRFSSAEIRGDMFCAFTVLLLDVVFIKVVLDIMREDEKLLQTFNILLTKKKVFASRREKFDKHMNKWNLNCLHFMCLEHLEI